MTTYNQFSSAILPGNYALTKSMELTKIHSSGTLWYTKKFLVLYYYVFLSNDIMTHEYVDKVTEFFDRYINSLPAEVQAEASSFFYPENPAVNFHSTDFRTFSSFASENDFENQAARTEYYQKAKKMYFAILMGSGGQTGVKKALKEAVSQPGFVYSESNIRNAIMDGVISVCKEQIVNGAHLIDNSVKYIISQQCIDEIFATSTRKALTEQRIREIINSYDNHRYAFNPIENDMIAFIRNERQILYYYGYFHSKTAGATDFEFSSLTPIGEFALKANYYEFLAIWEHQKLKMISQPATADINNIVTCRNNANKFGISFSPYTDMLGHILRQGTLSLDQYKYLVSRKKHNISEEEWILIENDAVGHIDSIRDFLVSCNRSRDIQDEDGRKELLKYALGLRSDLPQDKGTNEYGVISLRRVCACTDCTGLERIYHIYFKLQTYKSTKYRDLFISCEEDLRSRYISGLNGIDQAVAPHVKINWDLYIIRPDEFILLSTMASIAARVAGVTLLDTDISATVDIILPELNLKFSSLLKSMGYRSDSAKRLVLRKVLTALNSDDYSMFINNHAVDRQQVLASYRSTNTADLRARIAEISVRETSDNQENRVRNTNLISLLKSYYLSMYSYNNTLRCECCGEETFITDSGEPYVEFHHLIPFSIANGPDHYLNLFALCPNCHRKIHFLNLAGKQQIYANLSANNYMQIGFVERLQNLKAAMILRSYHLEYLLAENAITLEEYGRIAA